MTRKNDVEGGEPPAAAPKKKLIDGRSAFGQGDSTEEVEALRARARELESIMEMVPAVVFVAEDPHCRSIRTNRLGRELLRLPSGANVSKTAPPDQVPTTFKVCQRGEELPLDGLPVQLAARGHIVENFEEDILFSDGTVRHWIGNARPLSNEGGEAVGAVAAFIDITERRRAELALAASARQKDALYRLSDRLQRTESMDEIYDAAIEAIVNALQCDRASVLLFDGSGTMRFVGWRGLSEDYRRAAEGHSPWTIADKDPSPVCIADLAQAEVVEPLKSKILEEGIRALAFIPLVADGRLIGKFMAYFDRPYALSGDEIELCVTIARQLAFGIERKRADTALREADRRKDEFLAMLAHELRNPLASIANAVELLRRGVNDEGIQQQARAIIERQSGRLARLVDDLLEVSRITSGRIQLQRERTSLHDVVERAVETIRPMLTKHRHALRLSVPEQPIWVDADAARLEQVFVNLLNNAAKYTEDGGSISVEAAAQDGCAVVRVRDSGIGIEAELLPHVFDLFIQGQRTLDRAQGGLGIGLSLVQRLVEMHGGSVEVTSELGKGSEFVVRLPMIPTGGLEQGVRSGKTGQAGSKRVRILVVDDNIDAVRSLALLLESSGHEVFTAHDGLSAIELAEQKSPRVVVVDIGLPGIDGYEVARRLRRSERLQGALLIALTGYGQASDRERSKQAGFDRHLIKPADYSSIEEILAEV